MNKLLWISMNLRLLGFISSVCIDLINIILGMWNLLKCINCAYTQYCIMVLHLTLEPRNYRLSVKIISESDWTLLNHYLMCSNSFVFLKIARKAQNVGQICEIFTHFKLFFEIGQHFFGCYTKPGNYTIINWNSKNSIKT